MTTLGARSREVEQVLMLFTRGSQSLTPGSQLPPRCGERQDGEQVQRLRMSDARSTVVEQVLRLFTRGSQSSPRAHNFRRAAAKGRMTSRCGVRNPVMHDPRESSRGWGSLPGVRRASPRAHNFRRAAAKGRSSSRCGVRERGMHDPRESSGCRGLLQEPCFATGNHRAPCGRRQ